MASYTLETVVDVPREDLYAVVADRENYCDFLWIRNSLSTAGQYERQGVGAVHYIGVGPVGVQEQTTKLVSGECLVYKIVDNALVDSHIGTITLADVGQGTRIRYTIDSTLTVRFPAAAHRFVLRCMITAFVKGATRKAARSNKQHKRIGS